MGTQIIGEFPSVCLADVSVAPPSGRSALSPTVPRAATFSKRSIGSDPKLTALHASPPLYSECSDQRVPSHGDARMAQR